MIPITINGEKVSIKQIEELTTKEYIDITRIEKLDILKYISYQTGIDYEIIFLSKINDNVLNMIGTIRDISDLPIPKSILGYPVSRYGIQTVGQRFMIEVTKKYKGFDLLVYVVAVAIKNTPNLEVLEEFMERLYKLPYYETLPLGAFFLRNSQRGKNSVKGFLSKTVLMMRMRLSKKRRV